MKIFAIQDETDSTKKALAYLFYYENEKLFYIELPDDADEWETPLLLSSFIKKGEKTINSYWSKMWVCQRIVPPDRQNIGQILRDNHLSEYDEFDLLILGMGRCAQDDYYLVPIDEASLPSSIKKRSLKRIENVIPLEDFNLLVFFANGTIKKCSLKSYLEENIRFRILLKKEELWNNVKPEVGGYGITWDDNLRISDSMLYRTGKRIPLTTSDFNSYIKHGIVNVSEAAGILECSRQNIDDLTKRGKLHPVKSSGKNTVYLKNEILKRAWK